MAFAMYPGLTQGAIAALIAHGSDAIKAKYLPKMVEGVWTGTMNLTEPHCGTDLGLLRARAVKQADGSYKITGTKIFISAGEHDLAENIIHLVLARIEGAPEGTRGISLFVVPKTIVNDDGSLGERNAVTCGSIEEKMGIHGNATCVMNYDGAVGWLVGEENRGLNAMFTMMNEARLGVGIQGLAQSEVAYQNAAAYAKERLQGRAISGVKYPDKPADPIIVHPDMRRTLMTMRAFNEAARALVVWTGIQGDVAHRTDDKKQRTAAEDHMSLLTPVIKGVLTDRGFENTVMAQQVFGGHGYIAEHGMEQFVRDARIAQIYEGANGIQALDLVGRKLGKNAGRALMAFLGEVNNYVKEKSGDKAMKDYVTPLGVAAGAPARSVDVVHEARHDEAGQRRRRRHRLHASLRPGRARLHVGAHRGSRDRQAAEGERRGAALQRQARHRALLHGAHAAGNGPAPRAHPGGGEEHDGIAGRGVLDGNSAANSARSLSPWGRGLG